MEKTARILSQRLRPSGSAICRELRVSHDSVAVAAALRTAIVAPSAQPKLIVVFGASAVSDCVDVIPEAIRRAGGKVVRVGMPVDPGNLLVLGEAGGISIIGAPGCARSPKENGFDWVLNRILAGQAPCSEEIARMGVGGLLKEIDSRPQPRE